MRRALLVALLAGVVSLAAASPASAAREPSPGEYALGDWLAWEGLNLGIIVSEDSKVRVEIDCELSRRRSGICSWTIVIRERGAGVVAERAGLAQIRRGRLVDPDLPALRRR